MSITINEFALNLQYYLDLAQKQDISLTKDGKVILKLINPNTDRVKIVKELTGIIPKDITLEEAKDMRAEEL